MQGGEVGHADVALHDLAVYVEALPVGAVKSMSVDDVLKIVRDGETSVTTYFNARTRGSIGQKYLPIVVRATARVSLAQKYDAAATGSVILKKTFGG